MALEKLHSPPIVEVVCGVLFDPIAGLDPLTLGRFWEQQRAAYPDHQLHPPILEEGQTLHFERFPPIRVWMISPDDAWVLQVQWDRFYLNWRQRGETYPRFSDQATGEGVLSRFLREFDGFAAYCASTLGCKPEPRAFELAKIDLFKPGVSWDGLDDLAAMLPWLQPFSAASESKQPTISAQFREERAGGTLVIGVEVGKPHAKLETRLTKNLDGQLRPEFEAANTVLNGVFEKLIPAEERTKRFQGGKQ